MSADTVDDECPAEGVVSIPRAPAGLLTKLVCGLMGTGLALLMFVMIAVPVFIALVVLIAIIMSIF